MFYSYSIKYRDRSVPLSEKHAENLQGYIEQKYDPKVLLLREPDGHLVIVTNGACRVESKLLLIEQIGMVESGER